MRRLRLPVRAGLARIARPGPMLAAAAACLIRPTAATAAPWAGAAPVAPAAAGLVLVILLAGVTALYWRERRRREASDRDKRRLATIAEIDTRGVLMTDRNARVLWCNEAFTRLCGYDATELIGRTPGSLLHGPQTDPDTVADCTAAVAAGVAFRGDILNYRKNGKPYWARMVILPVSSVSRTGALQFVGFIEDVTEEKRLEDDLRLAIERAETANQAKSNFLSAVSHELRTPLNAVIGFAELLEQQIHGPLGHPSYAGYAADIHKSGEMLRDLIGGILDLSKIEAGTIDLREEVFDLSLLIGECQTVMSGMALERDIEISARALEAARLKADRRLFRQILLNLLTNACKFSPAGSHVEVLAGPTSDGFELAVRDHGVGIPADRLARVTEPFVQLRSPLKATQQGAGIGLTLVKQFAELHGGRLSLHSVEGEGTTVRVLLPPERIVGWLAEAPKADPKGRSRAAD